uniref:Transposon TX1 uncharacterized n=1 Tax=Tanacetum cinerariifolium TaxID=118510 RepID=A0A6L2N1J3_TANCI|nr:transposon TX1 uncharacterized [Tanacetum cinerariifolium]
MTFPNRLSSDQIEDLDKNITMDEIRAVVWDCGENKSPGLDGYTFEFFRRYWNLIGLDFSSAIECFFKNGSFPRGCNSSFIALIPKVVDAKFITDFRPISLIGSVYKVVTKILANHLAMVISDLKQGDPLAPLLLILVMESFHISISKAVNDGVFKGLQIQGSVSLSHLFYADDVVFIVPIYNVSIYKALISVLHEMEMFHNKFFNGGDSQLRSGEPPRLMLLSEGQLGMALKVISERNCCRYIRSILDDLFLPSSGVATRWVKYVPIKVNIFAWRTRLDRLPTRGVTWLSVFLKNFAAGGTFHGLISRRLKIGIAGSPLFVCRLSSKLC